MFVHPQFDPVAVALGPLAIRWYALSYILGFALFIWLGRRRIRQTLAPVTVSQLDDLLTWGVVGVILGGRLGYVLFYQRDAYLADPVSILKIWEGGMSFHGGFLGVLLAVLLFAKKRHIPFVKLLDFVAPLVPLGLASGRIGNFINGELWGRVTDPARFWATGFPQAAHADQMLAAANAQYAAWYAQFGMLPRHPSQLYQFALEGLCLFALLWWFSKKTRPTGQISALFLAGYGVFRFIAEFARQPDEHLGLLGAGLSMGQWLSVPMIVGGVLLFVICGKHYR
ncbi:prolipoprotein diacylglyceryl transferase [Conchiformibius kuhniae]|uniref:Phosphatidylglycerol--prolipoprotein diacylglyceryl transferase n=1 Tax=Conchiformibius kuhniae TaxID=211502 RepID=A0ABD8B7X6_9NEIS|nr:prolipoprotein diacylglyceryl transferase [Conchiformibius kuhniae]